jgi:hypothetical protein
MRLANTGAEVSPRRSRACRFSNKCIVLNQLDSSTAFCRSSAPVWHEVCNPVGQ